MSEKNKEHGIGTTPMVRPKENSDKYLVMAGLVKLLAARHAGLEEVPCKLMEGL